MPIPRPHPGVITSPDIFWGEIAPCEHLIQIYENDATFLDSLEGFVLAGLVKGDGVILIATPIHLEALEDRLRLHGFDVDAARSRDQFITLDAEATLAKFVVNGWPDEQLFRAVITEVLDRARSGGRLVRAFGEMVAVLWARGDKAATVRLEHLWHEFTQEQLFPLFCAYPRIGFAQDPSAAVKEICDAHTRVVTEAGVV